MVPTGNKAKRLSSVNHTTKTIQDILPSNQQQMMEQAKFTYSPLGKSSEKQIKTIKDQGEKQIKEIQDQGPVKEIVKIDPPVPPTFFTLLLNCFFVDNGTLRFS